MRSPLMNCLNAMRTPTAFRLLAQGCEARATLGHGFKIRGNPERVESVPPLALEKMKPFQGLSVFLQRQPRVARGAQPLGWMI